jgi:hypothetical protein
MATSVNVMFSPVTVGEKKPKTQTAYSVWMHHHHHHHHFHNANAQRAAAGGIQWGDWFGLVQLVSIAQHPRLPSGQQSLIHSFPIGRSKQTPIITTNSHI